MLQSRYVKLACYALFAHLVAACGGEDTGEGTNSPGNVSSSSSSSSSNSSSSSSSSSGTPVSAKSGAELYQEKCAICHQSDGKATGLFDMNILSLSEEQLYSEILLTMPKDNAEACGQDCAGKVTHYIRTTLFGAELAAAQKDLGVKPTKLLNREVLASVIKDTFAPITVNTSEIINSLPEPLHSEKTGFDNNAEALFSDIMLEDLYKVTGDMATTIANSVTVTNMCAGDRGEAGNSVGFSVADSDQWIDAIVDMKQDADWTGDIKSIRVDAPPNSGGKIIIDHVRLLSNDANSNDINLADWNNNAQVTGQGDKHVSIAYTNGKIHLTLDAANNDPYIRVPANHNINNHNKLLVRLRNGSDNGKTDFRIYFSPQGSTADAISNTQCANKFIDRFATKAFRKPLSLPQKNDLLALFETANNRTEGLIRLAQAVILSPNTVYQVEKASAGSLRSLTGEELAERLALFLWGSTPDQALIDVADQLTDTMVLKQHAERMLKSPKATQQIHKFVKEWLNIKNPQPKTDLGLPQEAADALSDSLARFFDFIMREEEGTLFDLYMDNRAFVTPEVAAIYGVTIPSGARQYQGGSEVILPMDQRAGIVTRAGFIAGLTGNELTSPTKVGNTIRERVLCQHIPFPSNPDDANIAGAEGLVGREFVRVHNDNPACAGCHAYLDNIGLIFETFNPIGEFRTTYGDGEVIDPSGYYESLSAADVHQQGEIADSIAFSALLSESQVAAECLAQNMMHYALDRNIEDDVYSFELVKQQFAQSNYQIKELILAIIQSDAFRQQGAE